MNDKTFEDEPSFSLNDFKKWISKQPIKPKHKYTNLIGFQVESKIGVSRLLTKIETTDPEYDLHEMATEFRKCGGTIIDANANDDLTIEVESGTFIIPKFFVKKPK